MKFLKIAFVLVAVMLVNLSLMQPSLADPNYRKNPDYIEVTKTLKNLQENAQGTVSEDVQRQIGELEFQKAAIESGVVWGQCHNETGGNLGIYGTGSEESEESGNPETLDLELNLPEAKVVKTGEKGWFIPNVSQAFVNSRIPSTFSSEEND